MRPDLLEQMIKDEIAKGNKPFYLNSVAGSTVMGSFDDMHALADICEKYNMWFNIDGCWGGFLSWADGQREKGGLFYGSERADSIEINAHKGFSVPNQANLLLINNKGDIMKDAFRSSAEYLFHDTEYTKFDLADKTLSCGRKPDAFKLWLSLQRYGIQGFSDMANQALEKARYLTAQVKNRPGAFTMMNEPMGANVCFAYTPPAFRGEGVEYTFDQ